MAISCKVRIITFSLFALFAISMLESCDGPKNYVSAVGLGSYPDLLRKCYGPRSAKLERKFYLLAELLFFFIPDICPYLTKHDFYFCNAGCMSCCSSCKCVTPGTYGYRWVCTCYDTEKTKKGGPKFP
ncbi:hypothetical protein MKX03_017132 [Papaver bracteatum]|nr:hypothetical protein MKX03_017132 [Papaver bracteatum]